MSIPRLACLVIATLWSFNAAAQLVVLDDDRPHVANPADQVPYPAGAANCNTTIADAGARAVLRAIDSCPGTFFESREQYIAYARAAAIGIFIPGATEAAGALALDKAKENALFCISGALIDESGASDSDKEFMKALVFEAKEINDRVELASKFRELRKAFKEKGKIGYLEDGEVTSFANTLDATLKERYDGRTLDGKLYDAGLARYDTLQTRARDATAQARALGIECRYGEAEAGLAQAQQDNLAYLADLRAKVSKAKHFRYCIERDARQQPINELNPASPFLRHSLESADADVAEAQRRDAEQTQFIGELADLRQSFNARRNDLDVLRKLAARHLESARQAAAQCDFASAASALDTLNTETLPCALQLDAERRARDDFGGKIEEVKQQLGVLETEYAKAVATPFEQISSCGELSVFADGVDQFQGQCRVIAGIDAKVATLRGRARACADFKTAAVTDKQQRPAAPAGSLIGHVTVTPPTLEQHGPQATTRQTYTATSGTWERQDPEKQATITWHYDGLPETLSPNQPVTITVSGGVVSESPKGIADGVVFAGAVAIYGDVTPGLYQQADRGHATGQYTFTVNPNAQSVEVQFGGAPAGTAAIWKFARPLPGTTSLTARTLPSEGSNVPHESGTPSAFQSEDPNVPHDMGTPRSLQTDDPNVPHDMGTPRTPQSAPRFIGCFKDTSAFDLDGRLERSPNNTPQACVSKCASLGFRYAGVQYGESCLCGNSYGRYGAAGNCDYRCTGDGAQLCGGSNANSVYATGVGGG